MHRVDGKSTTKPEWHDTSKYGVCKMSSGREIISVRYTPTPDGARTMAASVTLQTTSRRPYARDVHADYRELTCERYRNNAIYGNGNFTKRADNTALSIVRRHAVALRRLVRQHHLDMNDIPLVTEIVSNPSHK